MNQSIDLRALQWAYDQNDLSVTAKAVLVTFAMHANNQGYSWPGVERIAFTWGIDRETVRRQISVLLVRRLIYPTKKRYGATGQVKAYRLPKITYESGGKCRAFETNESDGKARDKRGISGGKSAPNKEERIRKNLLVERVATLNGSTLSTLSSNASPPPYSLSGENDLLDKLREMLGEREMEKNGGMWRMRMRGGKDYCKALRNALEDFQVKTPDQQAKIQNRGAWLTDKYERDLSEIQEAKSRFADRDAQ